jgi:hypothetical protein
MRPDVLAIARRHGNRFFIRDIRVIRGLSALTLQPFSDLTRPSHFPRNEPPNPAKYSSERPEMSSQ